MVPDAVAAALLLLVLLQLGTAAVGEEKICDKAICGRASCSEIPGPIPLLPGLLPSYNCTCDPGWSKILPWPAPMAPCLIPNCPSDNKCFNITPPRGIPITNPCVAVNCGHGDCTPHAEGFMNYSCDCHPGYANMFNLTAFPCVDNCVVGDNCTTPPPGIPLPPPSTAPPPGNHNSSGPAAPRTGPKGLSVLSRCSLLLLLVSLAMVLLA